MLLTDLEVNPADFESRTGWSLQPEGACKGAVCVPLPTGAHTGAGQLDVTVVAQRLGMPLAHDVAHRLWALGPETSVSGRALTTAQAPDLELPDAAGSPFRLSSLRGQKVMFVAWASW